RTIFVVYAFAFSVGIARLYSCSSFASETEGLMRACADALAVTTSPARDAHASTTKRLVRFNPLSFLDGSAAFPGGGSTQPTRSGGPRRPSRRESGEGSGGSGCGTGTSCGGGARRGRGGTMRARRRPRRLAVRNRNRATR